MQCPLFVCKPCLQPQEKEKKGEYYSVQLVFCRYSSSLDPAKLRNPFNLLVSSLMDPRLHCIFSLCSTVYVCNKPERKIDVDKDYIYVFLLLLLRQKSDKCHF